MLISTPSKLKLSELDCIYLGDEFCFILSEEIVKECIDYAAQKDQHNNYLYIVRGADPNKTFNQDSYSKLAEFAAKEFLEIFEPTKNFEVDTNVYSPNKKNWNPDIDKRFGVKSTSKEMSNYISHHTTHSSESWSFQKTNKNMVGGTDRGVFGLSEQEKEEKFFIFTVVETEKITSKTKIWIRGLVRLSLISKLFKDPIKQSHKGRIKVIYNGDLRDYQLMKAGKYYENFENIST
jgi:hypothetical protein